MGAAYGLLPFRFRERETWLGFRAETRFAIALQLMF